MPLISALFSASAPKVHQITKNAPRGKDKPGGYAIGVLSGVIEK